MAAPVANKDRSAYWQANLKLVGGLMLVWACDLIVASDDAFFADPVVRMGIPGVEYFAHAHVLGPRKAKEFLFLGGRMSAEEAERAGLINRVDRIEEIFDASASPAERAAIARREFAA